jgi:hypothetical protein
MFDCRKPSRPDDQIRFEAHPARPRNSSAGRRPLQPGALPPMLFAIGLALSSCSDSAGIPVTPGGGDGGDGQSPLLVLLLFLLAAAVLAGIAVVVRRRRSGRGDNP